MTEMMSEAEKAALVAGFTASKAGWPKPILGRPTGMKCECGGVLHERVSPFKGTVKGPRRSKKRRIQKKILKRWLEENRVLFALHGLLTAPPRSGYVCATCFRRAGFYHTIARNILQVEPLPPGALPIYDRDIDVAAIVTGD